MIFTPSSRRRRNIAMRCSLREQNKRQSSAISKSNFPVPSTFPTPFHLVLQTATHRSQEPTAPNSPLSHLRHLSLLRPFRGPFHLSPWTSLTVSHHKPAPFEVLGHLANLIPIALQHPSRAPPPTLLHPWTRSLLSSSKTKLVISKSRRSS